jgi:hypothetical protein
MSFRKFYAISSLILDLGIYMLVQRVYISNLLLIDYHFLLLKN